MEFTFDTSKMTQEEINFMQAALDRILYERGVTGTKNKCVDGKYIVSKTVADLNISQKELEAMMKIQADERERLNLLDLEKEHEKAGI